MCGSFCQYNLENNFFTVQFISVGDDPLFRGQVVASFVGLMFDLLSADLYKTLFGISFEDLPHLEKWGEVQA